MLTERRAGIFLFLIDIKSLDYKCLQHRVQEEQNGQEL